MNHFNRVVCSCMLLCTLPLLCQEPAAPVAPVPVAPSDVQRVDPPSPNTPVAELERHGDVLRAKKDYLDALDYYRAAQQKSDSAVLHNKIGVSLLLLKRDTDARREFERSIKLDGKYPEAHNNLGAVHYQMRAFGSAIREYRKAIKLNQESASFHSNLGTAYFSRKEYDKATKEYVRAMQLDPTIFEHQTSGGVSVKLISSSDLGHYHYVLAQMYGRRGNAEMCRLYLSKANEEGYPFVRDALKDNEFAGLRKDRDFVLFVRSLKPAAQETNQ
ncbi:MAG TPA: tetratricopeptide repeat protein [Candidatus Solibacter sp.]|jgi:tetratricopeptide (TPR) repeat protein|nr:tetratricopeptide repeat protein [Candidatus Solibacter sp.]